MNQIHSKQISKPSLLLLLRGFVDRKDWTPLSHRKDIKRYERKSINFLNVIECYKKLIGKLSHKYNVNTVVATYNTSRGSILSRIEQELGADIFLVEEEGSSQFTTVSSYLDNNKITTDYLMVLRSDLYWTDLAISEFASHVPRPSSIVLPYSPHPAFIREGKPRNGVPDCFHFMPISSLPFFSASLKLATKIIDPPHLHYISSPWQLNQLKQPFNIKFYSLFNDHNYYYFFWTKEVRKVYVNWNPYVFFYQSDYVEYREVIDRQSHFYGKWIAAGYAKHGQASEAEWSNPKILNTERPFLCNTP